jgi:glycosyltransferase involved in cell wall biosynthesis
MALGKPVLTYLRPDVVASAEAAYGVKVPIVATTKETLVTDLRRLVESPPERRRIGAESRAYVEQVHDSDRIADRLLRIYARL